MESILTFDQLTDASLSYEQKLHLYRHCLREFDNLGYRDLYTEQIRQEVRRLECMQAHKPKRHHGD